MGTKVPKWGPTWELCTCSTSHLHYFPLAQLPTCATSILRNLHIAQQNKGQMIHEYGTKKKLKCFRYEDQYFFPKKNSSKTSTGTFSRYWFFSDRYFLAVFLVFLLHPVFLKMCQVINQANCVTLTPQPHKLRQKNLLKTSLLWATIEFIAGTRWKTTFPGYGFIGHRTR